MSSKNRRRSGASGKSPATAPREMIDRLMAKGHFKDAVKQAKILHKQEPTPENHRVLERAYFERLRQLHQGGMDTSAREVAHHLLDFGVTDSRLVEPLAEVLLDIGMPDRGLALQARLDSPEARDRLSRQAADQAVLKPETVVPADLRAGAQQVRSALQALLSGDDARAQDDLRDVARSSPFGEWKRFVRGLAAYRRRSVEDAHAHWDRLDPGRAPARIARALQALDPPSSETAPEIRQRESSLEPLERALFLEPVLRPLRSLGTLVAQDRWTEAVQALGSLRTTLQRLDPELAVRLSQILYSPVLRAALSLEIHRGQSLLKSFTRAAEPIPIDPFWNRLWALAWEQADGGLDMAEPFWKKYLDDLSTTDALKPEDRPRAQALVWLHMGRANLEVAADLSGPGEPADPEARQYRSEAESCLEESLRLDPRLEAAYQALVSAYQQWNQPEKAAALARRRLQAVPDDYEALLLVSEHHLQKGEPAEALDAALKARALRPLDQSATDAEWSARVSLARTRARSAQFDEGRAELEAADRLRPDLAPTPLARARRAAFELKAGQADLAESILDDAQDSLAEPTPLWLAMSIEATRYDLPRADRDRFETLWQKALPRKVNQKTAAALAEILAAYLEAGIDYPGRETHLKQVLEYLGRTTRIKYGRAELDAVCTLLSIITSKKPGEDSLRGPRGHTAKDPDRDLYEKLSKRGLKLFPEAPEFPLAMATIEMSKAPYGGSPSVARKHLDKALKLAEAQAPTDPRAEKLLPSIRLLKTSLDDMTGASLNSPFGGLPPGALPPELQDIFERLFGFDGDDDDFDDDEFDDEFDDFGYEDSDSPFMPFPAPEPRKRATKASKKTKKKKKKK